MRTLQVIALPALLLVTLAVIGCSTAPTLDTQQQALLRQTKVIKVSASEIENVVLGHQSLGYMSSPGYPSMSRVTNANAAALLREKVEKAGFEVAKHDQDHDAHLEIIFAYFPSGAVRSLDYPRALGIILGDRGPRPREEVVMPFKLRLTHKTLGVVYSSKDTRLVPPHLMNLTYSQELEGLDALLTTLIRK